MRKQFSSGVASVVAVAMLTSAYYATAAVSNVTQLYQHLYGTSRVEILEVFGGHCEVSMRAYKRGRMTSQPYDIIAGCELEDGAR